MPQPTKNQVHVNRPLTNIAVAFLQDQNEFISNRVFPNVPVPNQSDSYFVYPKDQWFRSDAQVRAPSTESAGSGYELDTDTYNAKVYALHKDIDDQIRANADAPLNMDRDATEFVTRGLLLRREKDWAEKYFTSGVWTNEDTPSTKWDASGSTPISDMRAYMRDVKVMTGFRPNKLVMGEPVWDVIQDNEDFLSRISVNQRRIVTTDLLAAVLQLDEVLIGGAVQNVAAEKATADMQFIFSNAALLVYAAPRPSLMLPSAGYTFSWTGYTGAGADGLRMSRMRVDLRRCDRVEGELAYDQKQVAADLGFFVDSPLT